LYRIAQEALTNVMRHVQATTVTVTISAIGDTIRMVIADDGRGFDPAGRTSMERPSWGLLIMEERAHAIGATLRIESSPGSGTRVIVEVQR
jgi:signal transduction histidine kinase